MLTTDARRYPRLDSAKAESRRWSERAPGGGGIVVPAPGVVRRLRQRSEQKLWRELRGEKRLPQRRHLMRGRGM